MSAELLRQAAAILRERAEDARLGVGAKPWRFDSVGWCDPHGTTYEVTTDLPCDGETYAVAHTGIEESAAYIATMHPGVGVGLATSLREAADTWDVLSGPNVIGNVEADPLLAALLSTARLIVGAS